MAFTIADLSQIETDNLHKSVYDGFLQEAPITQLLPFETIGKLSTTIVQYKELPSVGFRKINAAFSESSGKFSPRTESISLCGGDIDVDKAIARASNTIGDARAIQQTMKLKSLAYMLQNKFINGSPATDPEEFMGIKERVNALVTEGFTDQMIDCAGTYGAARDAGIRYNDANGYNFLNKLDQLIYSIAGHNPDLLLMNKKTLLCVRSLLRQLRLLDQGRDSFDRAVDMYAGARLVDIGTTSDQLTEIITNTEDPQSLYTSDVSTSIYAVKFGIGEYLWGIQEYPMEITDMGLLQTQPVYRTEIDWPLGLAQINPRCMARLCNVFPDDTVAS